jgi:hypothetical protein
MRCLMMANITSIQTARWTMGYSAAGTDMTKTTFAQFQLIHVLLSKRAGVDAVRYDGEDDSWHCFGKMPNSIETGWWFAGFTSDFNRLY